MTDISSVISSLPVGAEKLAEKIDFNSETVFKDFVDTIEELGGKLDFTNESTLLFLKSLADLNNELFKTKESFKEVIDIVSDLGVYTQRPA